MTKQLKRNFGDRFEAGIADNDYRMYCEPLNKRASYKLCLHIIAANIDGNIKNSTYDKCIKAMKCNNCIAVKMALEEKKAGKIIYYNKLEIKNIPDRPLATPKPLKSVFGFSRKPKKPQSVVSKPNEPKFNVTSTGEMLQAIIKEELK